MREKEHPKNRPMPADQATPAAHSRPKHAKPYGYTYRWCLVAYKPHTVRRWFKSAASRDQAFEKEAKHQSSCSNVFFYTDLRKLER